MPQREFWTERIPTEVVWRYKIDPLRPLDGAAFQVSILDQEGLSIVTTGCPIHHLVTWEEVDQLLRTTWEAYLFQSTNSVVKKVLASSLQWKREAAARSNQGA
jgi:hypothetical protein